MRQRIIGVIVGVAFAAGSAVAQMHKVEKPQQVVRAVGVYEWTGDLAKPKASRLVPVALYINGEFQDAGVYMPQPVPFALDTGNVYELKQAGADKGTVTLEYSRHLQTANGDYEDGWMGYGTFKAPAPPKPQIARRGSSSGPLPQVMSSVKDTVDPDMPVLIRRAGSESTDNAPASSAPVNTAPAAKTTAASQLPAGENNPADDPDRPILKRPANENAGGNAGSGSTTASSPASTTATSNAPASPPETPTAGSIPESDPNRPTLKRGRSGQIAMEAQTSAPGMDTSLNSDPNRPILRPGVPAETTGGNLPKLAGMPTDMHQMVAVSDAVSREPHVFTREWEDPTEQMAVRAKIETMARAKLAAYAAENKPESEHTSASTRTSTKTLSVSRRRPKAVAAIPEALMGEDLKGYTLSYGGDPTYVYTAHTAGTGSALRYVTIVAQTDETGELKPVMASVTDAAHLDRTPEMKFIDVVDADGSNRASLLFEMKERNTRQFALYRVFAGQSQQIFLSGTTQ